jgi:AAA domain
MGIAHERMAPEHCYFLTEAVGFLDTQQVSALCDAILALPEAPVFIVIDTLARSMAGGDENSSKDMGLAIGAMDALRRATGATVLTLHHVNRAQGEIRGHSSLRGALDTELKTSIKIGVMVTVECSKQKDAEEFKPFTMLSYEVGLADGRTSLAFVPTHTDGVDRTSDQDQVLELLRDCFGDEGGTTTQWQSVCEEHHISEATFYRARRKLLDSDRVVSVDGKTGRGARYRPAASTVSLSVAISDSEGVDSNLDALLRVGINAPSNPDSNPGRPDQEGAAGYSQAITKVSGGPDSNLVLTVSQRESPDDS